MLATGLLLAGAAVSDRAGATVRDDARILDSASADGVVGTPAEPARKEARWTEC